MKVNIAKYIRGMVKAKLIIADLLIYYKTRMLICQYKILFLVGENLWSICIVIFCQKWMMVPKA